MSYIHKEQEDINACIHNELLLLHPHIRPIAEHILSTGGKRLRPILIILVARHFGCNSADIYPLAIAIELIHSATLLHDDILDNSSLRRGIATAHTVFGTRNTILAGDALLAKGCQLVASSNIPALLYTVSELIMDTTEGELEEIAHEHTYISFEQYIDIIRGKTAKMIQRACEMGAIFAQAPEEAVQSIGMFGENLGMAFQIVDDILDYTAPSHFGKPQGIDIIEGKLTAPLLLYAESLPNGSEILHNIVQKHYDSAILQQMIIEISKSNAIDKSYALVQEYANVALNALNNLDATEERRLLQQITENSIQRTL